MKEVTRKKVWTHRRDKVPVLGRGEGERRGVGAGRHRILLASERVHLPAS